MRASQDKRGVHARKVLTSQQSSGNHTKKSWSDEEAAHLINEIAKRGPEWQSIKHTDLQGDNVFELRTDGHVLKDKAHDIKRNFKMYVSINMHSREVA